MIEKDTFIFRKEWKDAIIGLPDAERLEIYDAIIDYGTSGQLPSLTPVAMMAFNFIKSTIDRDVERYDEIRRKRSEAGKMHKGNQYTKLVPTMEQNGTNESSVPRMEQNGTNGTNGTDSVSVSVIEKERLSIDSTKKEDVAACAAPPIELLEKRKKKFYDALIPYVERYGKDMVREFYDYWTEPNKSKTKMRFELERTWDLGRRLGTWDRNNSKYNRYENNPRHNDQQQRAAEAAGIIARLAAEDDAHQ